GGGDYSIDRIIPDSVAAAAAGREIVRRTPYSLGPYSGRSAPLGAYLTIAAEQWADTSVSGCYNIGPENDGIVTTGELADLFVACWNRDGGNAKWINKSEGGPHESNLLKLDCEKLKKVFPKLPRNDIKSAVELTVEWEKKRLKKCDMAQITKEQIRKILG
ncbi:MAG: CDP-glucose 4,6-dehydratase, partial [Clostridia bacterium]|nr:CDP-glucose 4,6-dehydratase [Clostridia bacterium]